jgi:5-methyltetrahydropteroyltriglutamate--homocysteine methyltransferase
VELRDLEDEAVRDVVAKQEAHGLSVLTDGEFRRRVFLDSFADVAGFEEWQRQWHESLDAVMRGGPGASLPHEHLPPRPVTAKLRLRRNRPLEEFKFAQALTERPVKATPSWPT